MIIYSICRQSHASRQLLFSRSRMKFESFEGRMEKTSFTFEHLHFRSTAGLMKKIMQYGQKAPQQRLNACCGEIVFSSSALTLEGRGSPRTQSNLNYIYRCGFLRDVVIKKAKHCELTCRMLTWGTCFGDIWLGKTFILTCFMIVSWKIMSGCRKVNHWKFKTRFLTSWSPVAAP